MFVDLTNSERIDETELLKNEKLTVPFILIDGVPYTVHRMQQCAHVWQAVGQEVGQLTRCSRWQEAGFTGTIYCAEHLEYVKKRELNQKQSAKDVLKNIEVNFDELF